MQFLRPCQSVLRKFCRTIIDRSSGYEGAGKTTAISLNAEPDSGILIDAYSEVGFRLNNDIKIIGPMAIFPRTVFSWNIRNMNEISEESLALFFLIEPKLDVLVIGYGDKISNDRDNFSIMRIVQKYRINCEILATDVACHTFNYLTAENRFVAAALIPPTYLRSFGEDDLFHTKKANKKLYEDIEI